MKALRCTALGLVVGVCLLAAAPAALADGGRAPAVRAVAERADGWLPAWLLRVAAWLGLDEAAERPAAKPRAVYGTACGDHGATADPNGGPCS
jgi:hypothetical protein